MNSLTPPCMASTESWTRVLKKHHCKTSHLPAAHKTTRWRDLNTAILLKALTTGFTESGRTLPTKFQCASSRVLCQASYTVDRGVTQFLDLFTFSRHFFFSFPFFTF